MKLITRDTDYALRALCFIARQKEKVFSADELVRKLKVPRPFLRKILQQLNKSRILHSHRGLGGGFSLAKSAKDICLLELIKIFQGRFRMNKCLFKKSVCPRIKICPLRAKLDRIEKQVAKELSSINIASLLRQGAIDG